MYFAGLVAIGWMYVTLMMAITQPTVIAGIATFFFYGLLPVSIIVYVMLAPERGRRRKAREAAEQEASMARKSTETGESSDPPPQG
jgi:TRAP-type C4-dicarboxylate transport system permease small subunit